MLGNEVPWPGGPRAEGRSAGRPTGAWRGRPWHRRVSGLALAASARLRRALTGVGRASASPVRLVNAVLDELAVGPDGRRG
jgi:hypothetical protein